MDRGMRSASTSNVAKAALSQSLGGMVLLLPCLSIEDDCLILGGDEVVASVVMEVSMLMSS